MELNSVFDKPFIFITGAPRSGTSLLTKIIGAHPEIAMIMENIFGNRRRHWKRADYWNDQNKLSNVVSEFYKNFNEPILGNKVCTPDVWSSEDIIYFCSLFKTVKILFIIRDPKAIVLSRHKRENHNLHFNELSKSKLNLDFSNQTRTFISSWAESIAVYQKLKKLYSSNISIIYYDDVVNDFENNIKKTFDILDIQFDNKIYDWHKIPHYNAKGIKTIDLKYIDTQVFSKGININELPADFIMNREEILYYEKFLLRQL